MSNNNKFNDTAVVISVVFDKSMYKNKTTPDYKFILNEIGDLKEYFDRGYKVTRTTIEQNSNSDFILVIFELNK